MRPEHTLKRRISRTFVLQAAAISVAAVVSVLLAAVIIKQVLVTEALRTEADHFWSRLAENADFPLPDTRNLRGFLADTDDSARLPAQLRSLGEGFHELDRERGFTTVYVTRQDDRRLYLVFDGERVDQLAAFFGLLPLAFVLAVLYLSVWLAYRASHRAVSSIGWLAREVNRLDPDAPAADLFDPRDLPVDVDDEASVLANALRELVQRLDAFVDRERTFTRDASHELRTPLTVIRMAADVLLARGDIPSTARADLARIRRSSDDMENLVEAFLLLAREADKGLPLERVNIAEVITAEVEKLRPIVADKPVEIDIDLQQVLFVEAPVQMVSAVLRNLVRNALSFTDSGRVEISVRSDRITIQDTGIGMNADEVSAVFRPFYRAGEQRGGHGVGLTIVRRFADRLGWSVDIDSQPDEGTRVVLGVSPIGLSQLTDSR